MRLYRGKIKAIASEILEKLVAEGDIEVDERHAVEVRLDLEAIMEGYLREESIVNAKAKELVSPDSPFSQMKKLVAEERDFRQGDEGIDWIIEQILSNFMHSSRVEEVYSPDHEMRRKMLEIFRKHLDIEDKIDAEVRQRIKHVKEGTQAFETEYARVRREVEKKHGLI